MIESKLFVPFQTESQGSCENNNAFAVSSSPPSTWIPPTSEAAPPEIQVSVGVISLVFVGFHLVTHFYAKDLHNRVTPPPHWSATAPLL